MATPYTNTSHHLAQRAEFLVNDDLARFKKYVVQATGSTVNWDTVAIDRQLHSLLAVQTKHTMLREDEIYRLSCPVDRLSAGGREPGLYAYVLFDRSELLVGKFIFHEHELHRYFFPEEYGLKDSPIGYSRGTKKDSEIRSIDLSRNATGELVTDDLDLSHYKDDVGWKRAFTMVREAAEMREYNYYRLMALNKSALAA